ncbi:MAG: sigma 54-interacting transcriptional regulator [Deltaproteobacteria bacterium]|nr:sigma 54-interacting transcriptional regulator [Deltaproteobacteria bacterium]
MKKRTHEIWHSRFLNQVIDSMAEGLFTLNMEGRISSWNLAMEHITGYGAKEALGQPCGFLNFSRCFGRLCPADINECGIFKHGGTEITECFLRHNNGRDVPVIKNARAVRDNDGVTIGVVETVTDLTELNEARKRADEAMRRLNEIYRFSNIIGKSQAMQEVFAAIKAAAASEAAILIQGDSGTGKELVAGAIHHHSERADKPLVIVNCSALSESLLESELFGHIRGAFTGAHRDRVGRFEEADGGTIFLDEIGEISPFIQVKLLRVLQEQEIERVGESRRRKIDVRFITATHQDLFKLVGQGLFRDDLYYRLKVFPIHLPPLRRRKEDIPLLVSHFIHKYNQKTGIEIQNVTQNAMRVIMDYEWPGNVRELENAIEHAFVLCAGSQIDLFDLPVEIRQTGYHPVSYLKNQVLNNRIVDRSDLSRERLIEVLNECGWNKAEAARRIGLNRTVLWRYMKKWDIPLKSPDTDGHR